MGNPAQTHTGTYSTFTPHTTYQASANGVLCHVDPMQERAEERFRALLPRVRPVKLTGVGGSGRAATGAGARAAVQVRAAGATAAAAAARVVRQGATIWRAVRGPAARMRAGW